MIEQLIERFIAEGKITQEEIDSRINHSRSQNPILTLQVENHLLKKQMDATSEYMEFLEEVVVEMIMSGE